VFLVEVAGNAVLYVLPVVDGNDSRVFHVELLVVFVWGLTTMGSRGRRSGTRCGVEDEEVADACTDASTEAWAVSAWWCCCESWSEEGTDVGGAVEEEGAVIADESPFIRSVGPLLDSMLRGFPMPARERAVMEPTISELIHNTLNAHRFRVKRYVQVAPKWKRDVRGRFVGGFVRKGYTRRILDRAAPMVSNMQMLAENVAANNSLLSALVRKKLLRKE